MPLRIAAKVPRGERGYFKEKLEPQIDGEQVRLTGEVNDETKRQFLADAAALLFPIDWPEPFGLVMIEAMACGTPVIAFNSGSVPEVIDNGITGFVVAGEAEAVEAIGRLSELDRREVRRHFEKRLSPSLQGPGPSGRPRSSCRHQVRLGFTFTSIHSVASIASPRSTG